MLETALGFIMALLGNNYISHTIHLLAHTKAK